MLGYRRIADAEEGGEFADRAFAVDQLADDHQPVTVGQRLEQIARAVGGGLHVLDYLFSYLRIYDYSNICQHSGPEAGAEEAGSFKTIVKEECHGGSRRAGCRPERNDHGL